MDRETVRQAEPVEEILTFDIPESLPGTPMLFSPTIGAAIAALLAYGRLRCRDQTATRRHYQTIAPANNRIHPAHSRHRLPRRHLPDAIRPFYHCRAVNNFTQYPALNSCWP